MGLVDRAVLLSYSRCHKKIYLVVNILLEIGYPLNFIFYILRIRLETIFNIILNKK